MKRMCTVLTLLFVVVPLASAAMAADTLGEVKKKGVVSTLKDLEGKKIAVVKGTTTEKNLREKVPSATVLALGDMRDVIDLLARGEVDIVSGDGITLYGYFMTVPKEKKGKFEIPAALALADENYGMAVRLGDKKFLDFVNGVLTELKNSGESERIFAKWLKGAPGAPAVAVSGYEDYKAKADQAHQRKKVFLVCSCSEESAGYLFRLPLNSPDRLPEPPWAGSRPD